MPETVLIALIGLASTFLSAFGGYALAARKQKAEIGKMMADAEKSQEDASKARADAGLVMGQAWMNLFNEMDERVKSLTAQICDLNKALAERDARIQALQSELDQLRVALTEKNGLVSSYEARIADLEAEVESLRQQLDALGQKPRTRSKAAVQ